MKTLAIVALALVLAACATSSSESTTAASQPREEKEYRIGSRIPVHDKSSSASPTATGDASTINPALPPKM